MKKALSLILVLVLVISLTACGKSEAAQQVDTMISGIGTVTLESEAAIKSAEAAYNALTAEQKEELENYAILVAARSTLDDLLAKKQAEEEAAAEAARVEAVKAVAADMDATIAAIGEITVDSGNLIAEVRTAYDALDDETKGYVTKLADLEAAEAAYKQVKADEVSALIDQIGTVTLESSTAINAATTAYNALPADAQSLVGNASVLAAAVEEYGALRQAQADKYLSKMRCEEDLVRNIKFYYCSTFPYYESYGYWGADVRCFVLPYMGVQGNSVWLRLVCDYTADDWLFFETIIFNVDGENHYKFFSYYDVVRDNAYGDIWEYVDIEVGESEIELLRAIAESERTIVRFQGDDYYDDFTVKDSDKQAIKEMLLVYEALTEG